MKVVNFKYVFIYVCTLGFLTAANADDTELYVNYDKDLDEKSRVIFVLDTSGSMMQSANTGVKCFHPVDGYWMECPDSRIAAAKSSLIKVIDENPDIDFGFIRFSPFGNGGFIRAKLGTEHSKLKELISDNGALGATPITETLWETYLYLTGQNVEFGALFPAELRDTTAEKGGKYISPLDSTFTKNARCNNDVHIMMISDGSPQHDNESNTAIESLHQHYFSEPATTFLDDFNGQSYLAPLAKIIHGTDDVDIDLYPKTSKVHDRGIVNTIGFGNGLTERGQKNLEETAKAGGGSYILATNPEELSKALETSFAALRKEGGAFSSPSIASNNTDQTRSRDALYYTMFYPSTNARWRGNLKKLKISGSKIIDSKGNTALGSNGLIKSDARTFWLPSNEEADGNDVMLGGVNLYLSGRSSMPNSTERIVVSNLYGGRLINFSRWHAVHYFGDVDTTIDAFGASSDKEMGELINWSRGLDVDDVNQDRRTNDSRTDKFGDPLHSKPVTIDYGNGDVRILIGTNAGYLHMFQDQNDVLKESWAFIPRSLYKIIKPLRDNQKNTKVYGVDGPISIFFDDKNKNGVVDTQTDRVWAFFGLRRGGNEYYALDITNPNSPKLMWGGPIVGGSGDFKELAQSWSKAQVTYINLAGYEDRPVLIFGAGYDTNKDSSRRTNDSKGRGIYIVDAETGKKVWALTPSENGFQGKHSIASDIALLDSDYDGYIDRLYATDTGGDVWRVDMPTQNSRNWTHFKLASLGGTRANNDRRFFYKPTIARSVYSKVSEVVVNGKSTVTRVDTPFDAVLVGSGNRANPLSSAVNDQLFMIRDINTVTKSFTGSKVPNTITQSDLMNVSSDPFAKKLDNVDGFVKLEVELARFNGWYYNLPLQGEKSLAASTVVGGVAYFTSFAPGSTSNVVDQCSLGSGTGGLYAFHLHYGTKVYDELKFQTGNDVPDTPQLFFGESDKGESQFMLIGTGIVGQKDPFIAKGVLGPGLHTENGKIKLLSDEVLGFKVQQTYIYKQEKYDRTQ
ncbi:pilin biogenesis protein [Pseudoalteromonas sp. APAL1]|uniref:PilC/PilY family type IV pilus protein n=1 Tax=Pseudoalteromonas TaxID=53246 RepID=UPI000EE43C6B|nr:MULTISPECIES: PilC/PilY family type IV pilus protein [unclassified Pseudoalteromonas]MCF2922996.1 pilin biogenesis protein [Pseudoalteromonas sp. APAL1]HCV05846.1 pilin biogenesis protein [Pseudoalteromonas sp.]